MIPVHDKIPLELENALFEGTDCDLNSLEPVFSYLHPHGVTFSDIFLQSYVHEIIIFEDSKIKSIARDAARGAGLRTVMAEKNGFAYTSDITEKNLKTAAGHAAKICQSSDPTSISRAPFLAQEQRLPHLLEQDLQTCAKVDLLTSLDQYARSLHSDIYQVQLNAITSSSYVLMMREDGQIAYDIRPMIRLDVQIYIESQSKRETAYMGGGGPISWSSFISQSLGQQYVDEAYRQALLKFEAQPGPSGTYDLVLGPGWPGILLHEAVGHGLEADFNRKKTSAYSDLIGEKIASSCCTVIDDGTLSQARGSLSVDDEGNKTSCNILIENGSLKQYMNDRQNAFLMNHSCTGNGRRQSFRHPPMPRMTNTYLQAGEHTHEEIIESLDDGVYAANFGGGSVDITSGQFVFSAQEAYRVKNGKILYPLKDMTLIGSGPEVMKKVTMVADNLKFDTGIGTCGKNGQSVPVGVGQPTLKVSGITLGGTTDE